MMRPEVVVVAIGNEWRCDDGVGRAVVERVAERCSGQHFCAGLRTEMLTDPLDLLGCWDGADLAVVVDATRSGVVPGTISSLDLDQAGPGAGRPASTHGVGVAGVLRLARAVDRAPSRAVLIGVEGEQFGHGTELSPPVSAAVEDAATVITELVAEVAGCV